MKTILLPDCSLPLTRLRSIAATCHRPLSSPLSSLPLRPLYSSSSDRLRRRSFPAVVVVAAANGAVTNNSTSSKNGLYTVGEFMTSKDQLHVVKSTTTVDEALEMLVENRITGFPVIDDNWNLVGLVSDFDLLSLDSISGQARAENDIFPEVDSSWKTFNEIQNLLNKTDGQLVGDVMVPAPVVVRETTNLEDAARLLLQTKFRRLPVVDADGKLVGIITRGNVVRAALQIKRIIEGQE
ncbi:hypothetical protein ACFE04_024374 [Oxalis oulophora]